MKLTQTPKHADEDRLMWPETHTQMEAWVHASEAGVCSIITEVTNTDKEADAWFHFFMVTAAHLSTIQSQHRYLLHWTRSEVRSGMAAYSWVEIARHSAPECFLKTIRTAVMSTGAITSHSIRQGSEKEHCSWDFRAWSFFPERKHVCRSIYVWRKILIQKYFMFWLFYYRLLINWHMAPNINILIKMCKCLKWILLLIWLNGLDFLDQYNT